MATPGEAISEILNAQFPFMHMLSLFVRPQNLNLGQSYHFQNKQGETISFDLRPTRGDGDCFFHAVNSPGFTRDALVSKLLVNKELLRVRTVFAHEIRQFLYLGYVNAHADPREQRACQRLSICTSDNIDIQQLFRAHEFKAELLRKQIDKVRATLGQKETHGKQLSELLALLKQKQPNSPLYKNFEEAYKADLALNKDIDTYCCRVEVFVNYVNFYLKEAKGYIPFSRELGATIPTTTIDVINELFELKIQVYLARNRGETQLELANQSQIENAEAAKKVIPIFHNGVNHFSGLIPSLDTTHSRPEKRKLLDNLETKETKEANEKPLTDVEAEKQVLWKALEENGDKCKIAAEALEHYEAALTIIEVSENQNCLNSLETAGLREKLAHRYRQQRSFENAREQYGLALAVKERHYGTDHIKTVGLLINLGALYREQEKFEEAKQCYERVLAIKGARAGVEALRNLGVIDVQQGQLEAGQRKLQVAWALYSQDSTAENEPYLKQIREQLDNLAALAVKQKPQSSSCSPELLKNLERAMKLLPLSKGVPVNNTDAPTIVFSPSSGSSTAAAVQSPNTSFPEGEDEGDDYLLNFGLAPAPI